MKKIKERIKNKLALIFTLLILLVPLSFIFVTVSWARINGKYLANNKKGVPQVLQAAINNWNLKRDTSDLNKLKISYGTANPTLALTVFGKVGIGTTDPLSKVHIVDDSGDYVLRLKQSNSGGKVLALMPGADNQYALLINNTANTITRHGFFGNGNVWLAIQGGRVGIGTDTPESLLDIRNNSINGNSGAVIVGDKARSGSEIGRIQFNGHNSGNNDFMYAGILASHSNRARDQEEASLIFRTSYDGVSNNDTVNRMIIKGNGNVGIGTSDPSAPLHVYGGSPNYGMGRFESSADRIIEIRPGRTQSSIGTTSNHDLQIRTNNTAVMTLTNHGNVGIGTSDPGDDRLDVRGRAYASEGWQTTNADYAEWFEKEEGTTSGDVIGLNTSSGRVRKYRVGDEFVGIHSLRPGVIGNRLKETDEEMQKTHTLVGLIGQLDIDPKQVNIEGRIVKTKDGKRIGLLLHDKRVLIGR